MPEELNPAVLRRVLLSIPTTLIFALFIRTFLIQGYRVASSSMEESLLPGDYILVNKMIFAAPSPGIASRFLLPSREPRRGDIILFRHPHHPTIAAVKRIAALPLEEIFLEAEVETPNSSADSAKTPNGTRVVLPDRTYYVLGDNPASSQDSRSWGPIHRNLIKGRPLFIYWSIQPPEDRQEGPTSTRSFRQIRWSRFLRWAG